MILLLTLLAGLTGILYSGVAWADEDGSPGAPEPKMPTVSLNEVAYPEIPEEEKNIYKIHLLSLQQENPENQKIQILLNNLKLSEDNNNNDKNVQN